VQINVSGHHVEVTPPMRQYVENKLDRLERHFDKITNIHVIFSIEKQRQRAEATIRTSQGEVFADAESEDLYAAIDMLTDKLDRQLIKKKEKQVDRKQRSSFR
jgi:putative sigma-54 modulation protein